MLNFDSKSAIINLRRSNEFLGDIRMQYAQEIWAKTLEIMERELGLSKTTINTWFDDTKALSFSDNCLTLLIEIPLKRTTVEQQYTERIKEALKLLFSSDIDLVITAQANTSIQQEISQFSEELSFERFIVGKSNDLAYAAAKAVAQAPGASYNPLFIYGGSGLGKTHLLNAIAITVKKNNPNAKINYVKGDDFTSEFIESIQARKGDEFREKYRQADLLLIDDIQFIAGKAQTQEEFFHTFNALYESKKQIVLTSDRLPKEMVNLEERLRTRFEWGLMADIQPPNYETRMAIISLKCKRLGLDLSEAQREIIANNVTSNVRQIEGTIKKIHAYSNLLGNDISQDIVERAIKDMFHEHPGLNPTPEIIVREVAKYFQVDEPTIVGKNKSKEVALPRQISMYLIRELIQSSFPEIGRYFNRDHSTVMHSVNKIEDEIRSNEELRNEIKDIRKNILEM